MDKFDRYLIRTRSLKDEKELPFNEWLIKCFVEQLKILDPDASLKIINSSNIYPEMIKFADRYFIVYDVCLENLLKLYYKNIIIVSNLETQDADSQDVINLFKSTNFYYLSLIMYNDDYCSLASAELSYENNIKVEGKVEHIEQFMLEVYDILVPLFLFNHEYNHLAYKQDNEHLDYSVMNMMTLLHFAQKSFGCFRSDDLPDHMITKRVEGVQYMDNNEVKEYVEYLIANKNSDEFEELMCDVISALETFKIIRLFFNRSDQDEVDSDLCTIFISQFQIMTNIMHILEELSAKSLEIGINAGFNLKEKSNRQYIYKKQVRHNLCWWMVSFAITHEIKGKNISNYDEKDKYSLVHSEQLLDLSYKHQDVLNDAFIKSIVQMLDVNEMSELFVNAFDLNKYSKSNCGTIRDQILQWK